MRLFLHRFVVLRPQDLKKILRFAQDDREIMRWKNRQDRQKTNKNSKTEK